MAKIALIGASGNVGKRILAELTRRGHLVTAIARHGNGISASGSVAIVTADVTAPDLERTLVGHDAVISSLRFSTAGISRFVPPIKKAGVDRYLVVGGAGSLEISPGVRLLDAPNFPGEYRAEASAAADFLEALRGEADLRWSYLSPSLEICPGERTSRFRLGEDRLLSDASGRSWITYEDFAVALVDELETPKHERRRFTVGY
ncbi:NAD(P)-dependent oxidoreductase [Telmatospirillum siberiense]|uniref:3-beta hydroxysteroid dehydrogenase n=1 Tax=Telmatospirillum siberiense TaxID=382514 RepID=A0A2N3PQ10_9PROT|nr:NAD(P)-dependent oxidoreductase [Telmatospirillum siberiense]PKU22491.1 3-beta hydroxysteroid dehydrogenase [Telmatospirillum siberiense]